MNTVQDKAALAKRSVSSPHGEFTVMVESATIQNAGLEVLVRWSVHHQDQEIDDCFVMDWEDPVLKSLRYSHETQELDQVKFAKRLLATLVVTYDSEHDMTGLFFMEENEGEETAIGRPLHWHEDGNFFTR